MIYRALDRATNRVALFDGPNVSVSEGNGETLIQRFTGFLDARGTMVFDGDTVLVVADDGRLVYAIVRWDEAYARWSLEGSDKKEFSLIPSRITLSDKLREIEYEHEADSTTV